jgi:5-methylcytosine-specific restriction endonuclease McrA
VNTLPYRQILENPLALEPEGFYCAPSARYASKDLKEYIYTRDAGQCQYCGDEVTYKESNAEHVIPWPDGATTPENLVIACRTCNELKMKQWIPIQFRPIPGAVFERKSKWKKGRR